MRNLLGSEFETYASLLDFPPFRGVRLNHLKADAETLKKSFPGSLSPASFSPFTYYTDLEVLGALPAYKAGMFYSQEPSATAPVAVLDPKPGEKVLDLCAAPGGKVTQIAACLKGEGLIWANEIISKRTGPLLSNIERMGIKNAVVSSCHPAKLCETLRGYFDKVLVDAPCSGEGMFRKDPKAVLEWTPDTPISSARRQRMILDSAALSVKPGGTLVYSTCTFSVEENEDVVKSFLISHPEFSQLPIAVNFGRPGLDGQSRRIYPMDGGEGQFMAKFQRTGGNRCDVREFSDFTAERDIREIEELLEDIFLFRPDGKIFPLNGRYYLLPDELPELRGLGVLRAGIELATIIGKEAKPCHGIFMSAKREEFRRWQDFSPSDKELSEYFRGEEISSPYTGYTAVCVNGVTAGFGKASGGRLKNHYPKGLRNIK